MQPPSWDVKDYVARLRLPRFAAQANLVRPEAGLTNLVLDGVELLDSAILQLRLAPDNVTGAARSAEHYVRGADLIATYEETTDRPLRAQVYWRTASHRVTSHALSAPAAAIELVTSVQTSLLDSDPRMTTQTVVPAIEVFVLADAGRVAFEKLTADAATVTDVDGTSAPACFLVRLLHRAWSYAEMVHPLDAQASSVGMAPRRTGASNVPGGTWRLRHQLFLERLEKGVILRARVLGLFVSREDDMRAVADHYAEFCAEEPPLTA